MTQYPVHTLETAPEKSRAALETLKQSFGLVPNLAATMASSPTLINGFVGALLNFLGGSFDAKERQVLLLTNAVANASKWAVAFHSSAALSAGVRADEVRALRHGQLPQDRRHSAIAVLIRALVAKRGHLEAGDLAAFLEAGYSHEQVLEAIAGQAASMMANYAGNITRPALEAAFAAQRWEAATDSD